MKTFFVLFLLVFFVICSSASLNGDYTIVTADNGNSFVFISMEGKGNARVPLPYDVSEPEVSGALYFQTEEGIEVSVGSTESAYVAFQTAFLTEKFGSKWNFLIDLAKDFNETNVTLSLPDNAVILNTKPEGIIEKEVNGSKNIYWNFSRGGAGSDRINVTYKFNSMIEKTTDTSTTTTIAGVVEKYKSGGFYFSFILFSILTVIIILYYYTKRKKQNEINVTREMQDIIRTLTKNERGVIETLIKNGGYMRRNDLGKITKISKSSLSAALYSLEGKNIVKVDRTFTVHDVILTDWFKTR